MHTRKFSEPSAISVPTTLTDLRTLLEQVGTDVAVVPIESRRIPPGRTEVVEGFSIRAKIGGFPIQYDLALPRFEDFARMFPDSTQASIRSKLEAERRRRWRSLYLMFRAKLEIAKSDVSTLQHEFLPWILSDPFDTGQRMPLGDALDLAGKWPEAES